MKATSLSVNLWAPCNAKCPFCISRLTWKTGEHSNDCLMAALPKAYRYAKWHGVDTVLVTSNGEPSLAKADLTTALDLAVSFGFPIIEMQTNGYAFTDTSPIYMGDLMTEGLTTLAISVAHPDPARSAEIMGLPSDYNYLDVVKEAEEAGLVVRVSLNLTGDVVEDIHPDLSVKPWTIYAGKLRMAGAHQLTLRALGTPTEGAHHHIADWIHKYGASSDQVERLARLVEQHGTVLRRLSYGNMVYEFEAMAVTIATCMTDTPDPDEIRSLILMPDGHLYHSWNHRGSILL